MHILPGEVLSILDTRQMNNSFAAISPCGRFVASAGEKHFSESQFVSELLNGEREVVFGLCA